jgi:hypothetical protein
LITILERCEECVDLEIRGRSSCLRERACRGNRASDSKRWPRRGEGEHLRCVYWQDGETRSASGPHCDGVCPAAQIIWVVRLDGEGGERGRLCAAAGGTRRDRAAERERPGDCLSGRGTNGLTTAKRAQGRIGLQDILGGRLFVAKRCEISACWIRKCRLHRSRDRILRRLLRVRTWRPGW